MPFLKPRSHPNGFYWGHQRSWTLTPSNSLQNKLLRECSTCSSSNLFNCRIGNRVKETIQDIELTFESAPCSILFPATFGNGLTATVLMQLLIEQHNAVIRKFYSKSFPDVKSGDIPYVSCSEIVHTSILVTVDSQDLHLALVANSEYNFGIGEDAGRSEWVLNEAGLEQQIVDKWVPSYCNIL